MSVLIPQSREELRGSIGRQYGGVEFHTATSGGSTSTFVDSELENTDNYINGREWLGTSGTNDGALRIVDDYAGSTTTGTTRGDVLAATIADGDTYELWDSDVKVASVHDAINRAIRSIPRKGAPVLSDTSLHSSTAIKTFTIPTATVGISQVQIRVNHTEKVLHNADSAWDELGTVGSVTTTQDPEDRREGAGSNKMVVAAGAAAGITLASTDISSLDISRMTHAEWWMKSTVATSAGDLQLILSATASAGTETELLSVPALVADTWTYVRVALANPEDDTAIISVGLKYTTDIGAAVIWVDSVRSTVDNSGDWLAIHRNFLRWDMDARTFSIDYHNAPSGSSYALIKLLGVKKPTELNADATECDVSPEYIINQATANLYRARGDRRAGNRDAAMLEAQQYEALALNALQGQSAPSGVLWIAN